MAARIIVVCPKCQNRMIASSEHIGREGRCQVCRSLVMIQPTEEYSDLESLQPESLAALRRSATSLQGATDVPALLAAVYGVAATALLYVAVFLPLKSFPIGELFVGRGVIPYVTTLAMCWGAAMLVLKYLAVKKQLSYAELELELIPLKIGVQITADNVDQFMGHLDKLPVPHRLSILGRRIYGALDHFRSRSRVPEVQQYLATQAEIDASQVDSGYTLLRAIIWAVPILGFIGTVMGISVAVGGLDATLTGPSATLSGGEALMEGMKQVTAGLATAFDTTLIALCMAILLLFPTESLRKTEYRMLDRIEEFANESLLRRLSDQDQASGDDLPELVRDALESAFQEHQRWLAQWQAQVARLGEVIGGDFEAVVVKVQHEVAEAESTRLRHLDELGRILGEVIDKSGGATTEDAAIERERESPRPTPVEPYADAELPETEILESHDPSSQAAPRTNEDSKRPDSPAPGASP